MRLVLSIAVLLAGLVLTGCGTPATPAPEGSVTLTYHANGGLGAMPSQAISSGKLHRLPANAFTRDGYGFGTWNTREQGGGSSFSNEELITANSDLNLYAQWIPGDSLVTFDPNGGEGSMTSQWVSTGVMVSLFSNAFTRPGYLFDRWNTEPAGNGDWYSDTDLYLPGPDDITLYAHWKANFKTVTFHANGASGTMAPQIMTMNTLGVLSSNNFSWPGFTFTGWNTSANGQGDPYVNGGVFAMGSADADLYAQWQNVAYTVVDVPTPPEYTVSFLWSSGTSELNPTLHFGVATTFVSSYAGTAVGYQWYLNGQPLEGKTGATLVLTPTPQTVFYGANLLSLSVTDANGLSYSHSYQIVVDN